MRLKAPFIFLMAIAPLTAGAADAPPTNLSPAQMAVLHPVFAALHAAHGGGMHHHGFHGGHGAQGTKPAGVETIHVDTTSNFAPTDGSAPLARHVVGDLSIKPAASGEGHTLAGTVTTTDANGTATVTLTDVTRHHEHGGEHCMLPSSGSASVKAADGSTHALTFSATCGQVSLDGTNVTLPMPSHHGHGDHGHDAH